MSIYRHVQQTSRNGRLDASITVIFSSVTITVQKKRESREKTDKSMLQITSLVGKFVFRTVTSRLENVFTAFLHRSNYDISVFVRVHTSSVSWSVFTFGLYSRSLQCSNINILLYYVCCTKHLEISLTL